MLNVTTKHGVTMRDMILASTALVDELCYAQRLVTISQDAGAMVVTATGAEGAWCPVYYGTVAYECQRGTAAIVSAITGSPHVTVQLIPTTAALSVEVEVEHMLYLGPDTQVVAVLSMEQPQLLPASPVLVDRCARLRTMGDIRVAAGAEPL